MPTPIREQILAAVTAAVGAKYAIGAPEPKEDLPATVVRDEGETATAAYGITSLTTTVEVLRAEKAASRDKNAMRGQCNQILADLVTELHGDTSLAAVIDGIDYTGGAIAAEGDTCFGQAAFEIRWHHVAGDPYTIDEPDTED